MCGIVAGIAERDVAKILLAALKRLEYRGYDSAGMAVLDTNHHIRCNRTVGKVAQLAELLEVHALPGKVGIAHTRWATHGKPHERNAHPLISHEHIALVHNGVIENHDELRAELKELNYHFHSETDTEVIVHYIHYLRSQGVPHLTALQKTLQRLQGVYALAILFADQPDRLYGICHGCPLVIGVGIGENFLASDQLALLPITQSFIYLQENDIVEISREQIQVVTIDNEQVERPIVQTELTAESIERGQYRHYMQKEIFEQPSAIQATLQEHFPIHGKFEHGLAERIAPLFLKLKRIHIVACGTSYHAGLVGRYWFESIAGIACTVEVASEMRYRQVVVEPGTLLLTLSQSGETVDTLAALRAAKKTNYIATATICNVAESALAREADYTLLTRAGAEIGVASTKAFTTQLVVLLQLAILFGLKNNLADEIAKKMFADLYLLPNHIEKILSLDHTIKQLAERFAQKQHALFLGRGVHFPIALEGALKLKEISYIHAEGYPAGELKHGPLALVDQKMPVIVVVPSDELLEKLKSNLEVVRARGGELFVFAPIEAGLESDEGMTLIHMPNKTNITTPIDYIVPLQLLAYHVGLIKGTDVDQPRNLAKSVTVE